MKAMILAAGLGTRLKPWTLSHPKALVPVRGVPMLKRVVDSLRRQGFDELVVNVHHFADQIVDYVHEQGWDDVRISDESGLLLDTGGGILHTEGLLSSTPEPFLVHNVDILSDADLRGLMTAHMESGADSTLLVSDRESSRRLIFDSEMTLRGWHSLTDDRYRLVGEPLTGGEKEYAFSGIHVMSPRVFDDMRRMGLTGKFPVMDYYLHPCREGIVKGHKADHLHLIDIGKPETLSRAQEADLNF